MEKEKMNKHWEVVHSEPGPDLKLFTARFDYMKNPRNDHVEKMIILAGPDSANVVPVLPNGDILFVEQFRFGIKEKTLELPGGIVDPGEDSAAGIRRELREETGYTAADWQYLLAMPSNPVFMDNFIHHWIARDVVLTHSPELDDGEEVQLKILSEANVRQYLRAGLFRHPHTVSALYLYLANK